MKVILISGKAQSGKDTAARLMKDILTRGGNRVLITHFADLLKYICRSFFDWDGRKDEYGRHLLQYVGTDVVRKQNPTLWVDFIVTMLKCFRDNWEYVIIPDCRFPNEVTTIIDEGFDVTYLRITRDNLISPLTEEQQEHPSETALDNMKPDYSLKNNGTLQDLEESIENYIKERLYE